MTSDKRPGTRGSGGESGKTPRKPRVSRPARAPRATAEPAAPTAKRGRGLGPTPGALRVVRRKPVAAPAPSASFPQTRGGSGRQKLLFELVRARVAVNAAVQGLVPGSAEEKTANGVTVRQIVLELIARDRDALKAVEAALRGVAPPWAALPPARRDAWHADSVREIGPLDWDQALRRLHRERDQLMESIESVPESPATPWAPAHPFGALLCELTDHDRRCADRIKAWRSARHN